MDGRTLDAGAVAGVRGFKNPILLARAIMEKSQHVFLIGEGAARFGREHGISFESAEYFLTDERIAELAETKKERAIGPDYSHMSQRLFGAVGAVARDKFGNLAADTSTGGVVQPALGSCRRFRCHRRRHIRGQRQLRRFLHGCRRTYPAHLARQNSCIFRRISQHVRRRGRKGSHSISRGQGAGTRRAHYH